MSGDIKNNLAEIEKLIEEEQFLRLSVLDVQNYDGTLVVMTDDAVPRPFVRMILRNVWNGPIEVFCASALMGGSNASLV
jgi:hypothetical protein